MSDLPSNPDLEVVLGCAYLSDARTARDNKRRTIADTLAHLVDALTAAKLEYVIAGALARAVYSPARYTKDIDVLALDESRGKIKKALTAAGFKLRDDLPYQMTWKDPESTVEVDILLGEIDPERSAVEDPGKARLLNVPALVTGERGTGVDDGVRLAGTVERLVLLVCDHADFAHLALL